MLRLKPTFEQIEREARTRRLRILPERERRTQRGILLDDVKFDEFDLDNYDKKTIIMNENPDKGVQTDASPEARELCDMVFNSSSSSRTSSEKFEIEQIEQLKEELSNISSKPSSEAEQEPEQPERQRSLLRRMLDSMFEEQDASLPPSRSGSKASGSNQPVKHKKSDTPPVLSSSSSSSSRDSRSVLLPVETQATPPISVQSSPPESIRSSRSNTIEYVPSSSSNRTVQYMSSGSSRRTSRVSISS